MNLKNGDWWKKINKSMFPFKVSDNEEMKITNQKY